MTDPNPYQAETQSNAPGALDGVRVLDLTIARAGPTCTRQLADMGAEVLRVGNPGRADLGGSDAHNLHRDKRSILLDLKADRGRDVFMRLVDRADVLVENFRAPVKARLGIDYADVHARNPRIIYASISGFGQAGPYSERAGVDQIAQGMSGLMTLTGPPETGPWRTGIAISDTASGTFLTQGVLAALYARERTGQGQWVHTSLLEALVNFMDFQATRFTIDGVVPETSGNDHPTLQPMGTFETADGYVNIAAMLGWDRFVKAIDAADIDADPRFSSVEARYQHKEDLKEAIEAKLAAKPTSDWVEILNDAGLPCGPVYHMDETFSDPQVEYLKLAQTVEHERDGPVSLLRHPVTFSETPARLERAAPLPGRHTREILQEHGFDADEIDTLVAEGVVHCEAEASSW
ncbi:MAG: CaiB/BaiF CoA-transferase family protein [Myxococcota bacterium]|jgi:crotonobetainyl-CoA:carnitine CoA-transferase CaiB-like acyl-CoA transferase|nr:CaiB/BaiF CoA-transferase family protein [Myxococcota bacterium]